MSVPDASAAHGYDARFTPVDTLMAAPLAVHFAVVEAMGNDDDGPRACKNCGHDIGNDELELCSNCFEWTYDEPYPGND